jgi:hypothetical protein
MVDESALPVSLFRKARLWLKTPGGVFNERLKLEEHYHGI